MNVSLADIVGSCALSVQSAKTIPPLNAGTAPRTALRNPPGFTSSCANSMLGRLSLSDDFHETLRDGIKLVAAFGAAIGAYPHRRLSIDRQFLRLYNFDEYNSDIPVEVLPTGKLHNLPKCRPPGVAFLRCRMRADAPVREVSLVLRGLNLCENAEPSLEETKLPVVESVPLVHAPGTPVQLVNPVLPCIHSFNLHPFTLKSECLERRQWRCKNQIDIALPPCGKI